MERLQEKYSVVKDENKNWVWFYTSVLKKLFYEEKQSYSAFGRKIGVRGDLFKKMLHGRPIKRIYANAVAKKLQELYESIVDDEWVE